MDKIKDYILSCEGGLNNRLGYLELASTTPGSATQLLNFEPGIYGGYNRISGYTALSETYDEVDPSNAEGKVLGVFIYADEVYAARKQQSGTTYKIYKLDTGSGWIAQTPGFTLDTTDSTYTVERVDYDIFNFNGMEQIIFTDGVNPAYIFDGTNWTQIESGNSAADYANAGGSQVLDQPRRVEVYKSHIFLSGDPTAPGVVCYSAPRAEYDWTAASGAGQVVTGYSVNAMKVWREFMYCFGQNNIGYIAVSGTDFVFKNVSTQIGCIAPFSVVEFNSDLLYLSQDGFRVVKGTDKINDINIEIASKNIHKTVTDLTSTYTGDDCVGVIVPSKSQARFFWNSPSTPTVSTRGVMVAIREGQQGIKTNEWAEMQGFQPYVATYGRINNVEYVLHGDYDGLVYRQEQGSSFNGENIPAIYTTPDIFINTPTFRKTIRKVDLWVDSQSSLAINTAVVFDWADQDKLSPDSKEIESNGGTSVSYGSGVKYGQTGVKYGAPVYPLLKGYVEGTCKALRFSFSTNGTESPYAIQSIVIEYSEEGRR